MIGFGAALMARAATLSREEVEAVKTRVAATYRALLPGVEVESDEDGVRLSGRNIFARWLGIAHRRHDGENP